MGGRYLECACKLHGNPISFIDRAATVSSTPAFGFTMLSNKRCPNISRHLYITPGRQILPVFAHLFFVHVLVGHSFYMSLKILYVYGCFVWISVCTPPMVSVRRCRIPWDWSLRWVKPLWVLAVEPESWESSQCSLMCEPALQERSLYAFWLKLY